MADITMCHGMECNLKAKCYRYTAEPNPYRQSYFMNVPFYIITTDVATRQTCDHFSDNEGA